MGVAPYPICTLALSGHVANREAISDRLDALPADLNVCSSRVERITCWLLSSLLLRGYLYGVAPIGSVSTTTFSLTRLSL
jgi:hypothetical protein